MAMRYKEAQSISESMGNSMVISETNRRNHPIHRESSTKILFQLPLPTIRRYRTQYAVSAFFSAERRQHQKPRYQTRNAEKRETDCRVETNNSRETGSSGAMEALSRAHAEQKSQRESRENMEPHIDVQFEIIPSSRAT